MIFALIIAFMAVFFYLENNWIGVTRLELRFANLPDSFKGYRIVQLSDLHGKFFGKGQSYLVERIGELKPDIIVITGDLADSRQYDEQPGLELIRKASGIAPVYYVTGNHEFWSGKFINFEKRIRDAGAVVLRNEWIEINSGGQGIFLAGVDDLSFANGGYGEEAAADAILDKTLSTIPEGSFKVLLSHRPDLFPAYISSGANLVFTGHAHGGQFRLPFAGGLVAPDQGFFPKYTSGVFEDGNTKMVVNRGLGNSIIPLRIFNRPEIILAILN